MDGKAAVGPLAGGLAAGGGGPLGRGDDGATFGCGRLGIVIVEEDGGEAMAHVPFDIVGEHAEEDVGTDAVAEAVVDGTNLEIDGLDRAKGALDLAEALVGPHAVVRAEDIAGDA